MKNATEFVDAGHEPSLAAPAGVELQTLRDSEDLSEDLIAPRRLLLFCYQSTARRMPPDLLTAEIVEELHSAPDVFALIVVDTRAT